MTAQVYERRLVLFVPGLSARPAVEGAARRPALETLLARAERFEHVPAGHERRFLALFGLPVDGSELPIASLTRIADSGRVAGGAWLRADPVFLQADGARLVLAATTSLTLTRAEAEAIQAELHELLAAEGLALEALNPHRWYLKLPQRPGIRTHAPRDALGRDIHDYLPAGEAGQRWRRLLNEVQMVLHASPINAEREARGDLPINSLWFWGAGSLPVAPARVRYVQVWTEAPLGVGLARLANLPIAAPVPDLQTWLNAAITPGEHLVVLDSAVPPLEYGDAGAWSKALARFETDWFAPLIAALRRREIAGLTLYSDDGPGFSLDARSLRRWWRRRRPLSEYR